MTGTQHGAIDFEWLLANLEVGQIPHPNKENETLVSFIINQKAIFATESYIQGLMQLYSTVYLHKTTRSAEVMFSALMEILFKIDEKELEDQTGLNSIHPLYKWLIFYKKNSEEFSSESFLALDDSVIWGSFAILASAKNKIVSLLADSLQKRKLYKCIDVRKKIQAAIDPENIGSSELARSIEIISKKIEIEIDIWKGLENNEYRILQD
ncbi:MAG: hypothetical protein ORO03_04385, partial [Alphaproteobacteria bacterium]|nr:hypothetical protein [Alphaproteobacteria bacterium]